MPIEGHGILRSLLGLRRAYRDILKRHETKRLAMGRNTNFLLVDNRIRMNILEFDSISDMSMFIDKRLVSNTLQNHMAERKVPGVRRARPQVQGESQRLITVAVLRLLPFQDWLRFWCALRANIDETVLPVVITEQGENRNQCEEQRNLFGFPHGFARRWT